MTFDPGLSYYDSVKHLLQSHWAICNENFIKSFLELRENSPGNMTNMVTMPVHVKYFSLEPVDRLSEI